MQHHYCQIIAVLAFTGAITGLNSQASSQEAIALSDILQTRQANEGFLNVTPWPGARIACSATEKGLRISLEDDLGAKLDISGPFIFAEKYAGQDSNGRLVDAKKAAHDVITAEYQQEMRMLGRKPDPKLARVVSTEDYYACAYVVFPLLSKEEVIREDQIHHVFSGVVVTGVGDAWRVRGTISGDKSYITAIRNFIYTTESGTRLIE